MEREELEILRHPVTRIGEEELRTTDEPSPMSKSPISPTSLAYKKEDRENIKRNIMKMTQDNSSKER